MASLGGAAGRLGAAWPVSARMAPVSRRLPLDLLVFSLLATAVAAAWWSRRPEPRPRPEARLADGVPGMDLRFELDGAGGASWGVLNREAVELAQAGRYAEAAVKLRAALAAAPENPVLRKNLRNVLAAWGARELEAGHAWTAADRFNEALAYGRAPALLTGLGIAQLQSRQFGDAIDALEEALAAGAGDPATLLALAEAYEATDERVRALEMVQRAQEAGADSPALRERLERLAREVDAEWDFGEESSRHFRVRFDDGDDPRAAEAVLRSLEDAYQIVGRKLGYFPDGPLPVVLYADRDFHRVTQTPDWAGAAFDGRLKFPARGLVGGQDLDRVARHEYAHAVIHAVAANRVPVWLNEGLAMWAEEDHAGERRAWAESVLAGHAVQPLDVLERPFAQLPRELVQPAYAQSYLTVLLLAEWYDERRIPRLLEEFGRGGSAAAAFDAVYPVDLERFEEEVAAALE